MCFGIQFFDSQLNQYFDIKLLKMEPCQNEKRKQLEPFSSLKAPLTFSNKKIVIFKDNYHKFTLIFKINRFRTNYVMNKFVLN